MICIGLLSQEAIQVHISSISARYVTSSAQSAVVRVSSELQTGHREMDKNCRLAPETTSSKAALQHFKDDDGWNMLERVSHSKCMRMRSMRKRHHGRHSNANYFPRCDSLTTSGSYSVLYTYLLRVVAWNSSEAKPNGEGSINGGTAFHQPF